MKLRALVLGGLGLLSVVTGWCAPAAAEDYPSRSVRLIIPFPPGGSNDVVGRIIANQIGGISPDEAERATAESYKNRLY